ncbi:hypothetical protein DSO57_1004824 [Entomophthora muscae]|uniref:Uncharacterized protein n=1 Tax=Entomophthora muscae TaxID=34485 RepID=A0ACC2RMU7_9FUNG|nr:hypothetical protein DSO57_1004824 [Entomophthora muscae]
MTIPTDFQKTRMDSNCKQADTDYTTTKANMSSSNITQTNAMVITGLTRNYFEGECLQGLREIVAGIGPIQTWAPLKSLCRIIVVFDEFDQNNSKFGSHVRAARIYLNDLALQDGDQIKVYTLEPVFAPNKGIYLEVQKAKKLWLISPPASPPSDWEATEEEPPNSTTFSQDLIRALEKLEISQDNNVASQLPVTFEPQPTIQLNLGDNRSDLPTIFIEDCCSLPPNLASSTATIPRTPIPGFKR